MSIEIKGFPVQKYYDAIKESENKLLNEKRKQLDTEKLLSNDSLTQSRRDELNTILAEQRKVLRKAEVAYGNNKRFVRHEIRRHLEFLDPDNSVFKLSVAAMEEDYNNYKKHEEAQSRYGEALLLGASDEIVEALHKELLDDEFSPFGFTGSKNGATCKLRDFQRGLMDKAELFEDENFNFPSIPELYEALNKNELEEASNKKETKRKFKAKP